MAALKACVFETFKRRVSSEPDHKSTENAVSLLFVWFFVVVTLAVVVVVVSISIARTREV